MTAMGRLVRRGLIVALAAVIASTAGLGQNRVRQANIGYISPSDSISINEYLRGVRRGLSNRRYVEGRNLVIEERYADGFTDRLPSLISGLLAKKNGSPHDCRLSDRNRCTAFDILSADRFFERRSY